MKTALLLTALLLSPLVQRAQCQWIQTNGPDNGRIGCLASIDTILFAGTDGGVFVSTDRAESWTHPVSELWAHEIGRFAVMGTHLFAGTWEGGVFLSESNGANWREVSHTSTVDPNFRIPGVLHALAVDGTYLYAGERRTGLWRRPLSEMVTGVDPYGGEAPLSFFLHQNFPNPFNPSATIRYALPQASAVHLTVFNTLGQEVALLQRGEMEAGHHEVTFNGAALSSGVYFCRLQARPLRPGYEGAADFLQIRKLVLLR